MVYVAGKRLSHGDDEGSLVGLHIMHVTREGHDRTGVQSSFKMILHE
jgi:hypothetical protein